MLKRRNPNATFEQPAAEATAPAPAPAVPPQQPEPASTPATPATPATPQKDTGGGHAFPQQPSQASVSGSAETVGEPATTATVAMVRRDASAGAMVQSAGKMSMALEDLKNLFTVDYDTFERLKSGSGNIVDSQNNSLGTEIALTVLSWQDAWDLSPGSQAPEAKKVVKYSDDGVRTKDTGELIEDYLQRLRNGEVDGVPYPNAKKTQKKVVVGVLEGAEKDTNLLGRTVQVSLSQQSAKTFDRHRFDYTLQMQMGKRTSVAGAEKIRIKAESRSSNNNNYTLLLVSADDGAV